MKKRILMAAFVAVIAIFAGTTVYNAQKPEPMSDIALANVEVLADAEQSNVNDCRYDPDYDCEALHPTDPTQDKRRSNAKWD